LKDLSSTKGTHGIDATPYELWFGKKPNIQYLRVWGCTAYTHIYPAKRADKKWSPRVESLIFIGYTLSTKQYRLYDAKLKKLITARADVFHEDSPFYKPLEQQIFCPVSSHDSIVSVSHSTREHTDFDQGMDDVDSLSSDDFDHATDAEEEGEPEHSGESQHINLFAEVRSEPGGVVKKTP